MGKKREFETPNSDKIITLPQLIVLVLLFTVGIVGVIIWLFNRTH
jgi:flagellar basal body-associated protein FliL